MKKANIKRIILIILVLLVIPLFSAWFLVSQPSFNQNSPSAVKLDRSRLREHVVKLSNDFFPRNYLNTNNLDLCAEYIFAHFKRAGADTSFQEFTAIGKKYKNVIGMFGPKTGERIVIGAHYDAFKNTPGADDNASGVSGLIELAYLVGKTKLNIGIEFVAYSLEEPPFFSTKDMGSAHHAKLLHAGNVKVRCMIALEMIGYFSNEPGSQLYPIPAFKIFYPSRGNFMVVAGAFHQRKIVKQIKQYMQGAANLPVYSINAPMFVTGVDYSDHRNYWKYGYDAVMITDTAFYRNLEYHKPGDTPDRLNYGMIEKVVIQIFEAVKGLAG